MIRTTVRIKTRTTKTCPRLARIGNEIELDRDIIGSINTGLNQQFISSHHSSQLPLPSVRGISACGRDRYPGGEYSTWPSEELLPTLERGAAVVVVNV